MAEVVYIVRKKFPPENVLLLRLKTDGIAKIRQHNGISDLRC